MPAEANATGARRALRQSSGAAPAGAAHSVHWRSNTTCHLMQRRWRLPVGQLHCTPGQRQATEVKQIGRTATKADRRVPPKRAPTHGSRYPAARHCHSSTSCGRTTTLLPRVERGRTPNLWRPDNLPLHVACGDFVPLCLVPCPIPFSGQRIASAEGIEEQCSGFGYVIAWRHVDISTRVRRSEQPLSALGDIPLSANDLDQPVDHGSSNPSKPVGIGALPSGS